MVQEMKLPFECQVVDGVGLNRITSDVQETRNCVPIGRHAQESTNCNMEVGGNDHCRVHCDCDFF